MKLVYLVNIGLPTIWAHGIQITKMCEAFADFGIGVELVVPMRRNEIKADPFDYYGIKRNFKITKLPCLDLCPGSDRSFYFWLRLISFLLSAKIYLFFKKFDILYTRDFSAGLFFKNFFLEIHSLSKKIKLVNRLIWKRAKALVVLTGFIKNRLTEAGIPENKILVASDAVDLKEFDIKISKEGAREKLELPQGKYLIGYLGMLKTMSMGKGIDTALRALKHFDNNFLLVLVGGGEEDIAFYRKLTEELGLEPCVRFVGMVKHQLTPFYLKAFDVLIAPFPAEEHYKFYMSPLKIFEYMASKRPIVVSDLPSIKEILNENNAVLIEPNNPAALAEGIKKALDKDLAKIISEQAYCDVQEHTWQKRAQKILDFIYDKNI